ncbi:autotransporter secretion outer membrane protein TamA [Methylobacillus rhizosphaerae]|uniref:Autotransporter secretion outer membrane protein TamA n=1 Tax=Methylobacillus rhizosphaerae TaxID=551994 RepID=A0A238YCV8_9PROT|nr:autotransporter assembly complex family protein [Methylobacillus rhizosphaerae]SNR68900.1 autotransporter secretion outer membrane protein TamA [Methylobacillus rhizosphaerae]
MPLRLFPAQANLATIQAINAYFLAFVAWLLLAIPTAHAADNRYSVDISAPSSVDDMLEKHLEIRRWLNSPRMNTAEWHRLLQATPRNIEDLLTTEGYFSPRIEQSVENDREGNITKRRATFTIDPGEPATIQDIDIRFSGAITSQAASEQPDIAHLLESWSLKQGMRFSQDRWDSAKRGLLSGLVLNRYPNAKITSSKAVVDAANNQVKLSVEIDSGAPFRFGGLEINGLQRYPPDLVENINPIKPGETYSQARLLFFQSELQASGYFSNVEVTSRTDDADPDAAPIIVNVTELQSIQVGIGVGASTNTGARTTLTYQDLNLFNRGWRFTNTFKLEQKAQSLSSLIRLPTDSNGFRDSFNADLKRIDVEGQITSTLSTGVKRAWGPRSFEQTVGAGYLLEHVAVDGSESQNNYAATLSYGITLRRTDNELNPTRGYLFNAVFTGAPLDVMARGQFLQSYAKTQAYYPITRSTQLITRLEVGAVSGANNAPATYLFRAGGDQSVRGYAYQSLGIADGDAVVGGRYLVTGSIEVIQWLTASWGAAAFVDFGNAANNMHDLKPVYGYGLGARFKSPAGPIGIDIAHGQETGEYRLHFNLGVTF